MSSVFNYSQIDPETAEKLKQQADEIKKIAEDAGRAFWKAGIQEIGSQATMEQIANLLSSQWGHDKDFIINCMKRVKKPWS